MSDRRNLSVDAAALPAHFCAVYWKVGQDRAEQRLLRTDIYRDGYMPVGGVYLPLSRRVVIAGDSGTGIWQIMLRDHQLLQSGEEGESSLAVAKNAAGTRTR